MEHHHGDNPVFRLKKSNPGFFYDNCYFNPDFRGFYPLATLVWKSGGPAVWLKALKLSLDPIFYSITVSFMSALLMAVFSFLAAWYLLRVKGPLPRIMDYLFQLPFGIPSVSLGVGLIHVWNQRWVDFIYDSTGILIIRICYGLQPLCDKNYSFKNAADRSGIGRGG